MTAIRRFGQVTRGGSVILFNARREPVFWVKLQTCRHIFRCKAPERERNQASVPDFRMQRIGTFQEMVKASRPR
jgi:hypothetical protein